MNLVVGGILCVLLSACGTTNHKLDSKGFSSAADYMLTHSWRLIDRSTFDFKSYRVVGRTIYRDRKDEPIAPVIHDKLDTVCRTKGGRFSQTMEPENRGAITISKFLCINPANPEEVLFALVIQDPLNAAFPKGAIGVEVTEPTGSPLDPEYVKRRLDYGFFNESEAEQIRNQNNQRNTFLAAERNAIEVTRFKAALAKHESERKFKTAIGAQICKTAQGVTYTGFTENISPNNGKIQIRVAAARFGNSGLAPGNFSPSIIWDSPENWELCY